LKAGSPSYLRPGTLALAKLLIDLGTGSSADAANELPRHQRKPD
jgi:hypothetical protein